MSSRNRFFGATEEAVAGGHRPWGDVRNGATLSTGETFYGEWCDLVHNLTRNNVSSRDDERQTPLNDGPRDERRPPTNDNEPR